MPQCRICNAEESFQTVQTDSVFGGKEEHKFWRCSQCEVVYLFPVPTIEEDNFFYQQEFEKFMSTRSGSDRDWSSAAAHVKSNQDQVKRRWKFLKKNIQKGKELLEIGCSSGFMMDEFCKAGLKCTGVEPSGEFIEFLEQNGHESFKSLDELKQKRPDKKFDLIVHFFVFEHIRDPFEFLKDQLALLKPGGKIIAEVPCANDPLTSLYNIPAFEKFFWSIAHHYYYNPKSISYVLDQLDCHYHLIPEQRYDLSNHITWMTEHKPGGQGKFQYVFSHSLIEQYKEDLKSKWLCDTMIVAIDAPS
jgi:2-polyprenyl-3-methyl-5-hydroxy-6-metoxy-1,4-benzoquinol methylase